MELLKINTSFLKLKSIEKKEKKNKSEGFFKDEAKIKDRYFMNIGKNNSYKNFLNVSQISKLKDSFGEYIEKYNL